ncbi:MAG: Nif3-like dinuclear metal center hexameric protein [Erysipelotrichaceae bacterium]|nr:Nif3-like dinuclear metal center hexameric protein [Erysipelotrichaceae bacterium]
MLIKDVIGKIKAYSRGISENGKPINDLTTRDQVLYGETEKECTGIVTTCFASVDVIRKAHELGANLIISHEALFYNHGDHTDWLIETENKVFVAKKELLESCSMTVWRNHDYIHSGIPDGKGGWDDGIFKGFLSETGLIGNYIPKINQAVRYYVPCDLAFDNESVESIAAKIIKGAGLNGLRIVGDPKKKISRAQIPLHIMGLNDNETIKEVNRKDIDLLITMEQIDFTVTEYMRDGHDLEMKKEMINVGHFNLEEPGMKYMLKWLPEALGNEDIPLHFVKSGDPNHFLLAESL